MKLKLTALFLVFAILPQTHAQPATPTLSGTLTYPSTGPIYLQLVNRQEFEDQAEGQYNLVIDDAVSPASYTIEGIEADRYIVRAFQDTNGNGKLDMGMFGPKEPWLVLGYQPSAFKRPNFDDHSIAIEGDMTLDLILLD